MAIWISKSSTRQIIKLSEEQNYPNYNCVNILLFLNTHHRQALQLLSAKTTEEKLQWAFKLYDEDNSGLIDQSEMANIMTVIFILHRVIHE